MSIFNKKATYVMSLIGINRVSDISQVYELIDKLNSYSKPPDIISDLSLAEIPNSKRIWQKVLNDNISFSATIPCYYINHDKNIIDRNELLDMCIQLIEAGVKILTIHATPSRKLYEQSLNRMIPITSRGGSIIINDLISNNFKKNNAYLEILPALIKKAKQYNVIISIGSSFRSANIFDSLDSVQLLEFKEQKKIAEYLQSNKINILIETPGHASPQNILKIAKIFSKKNYPLMPLGPIVTDIGEGMDHITSSIGSVILGMHSNLKVIAAVTSEEHTGGIPNPDSIIYAFRTARLAAHIIDIYKYNSTEEDYSIALKRATNYSCISKKSDVKCNRCSKYCPLKHYTLEK